ncbi:MAG: chromosomal replication initiator protein DnaA [Candidatus Omnitrophica bacterium]|nr:chromosomal replication initiator protein DnaA [Candidatus Omnitrophota bacterium]
MPSKATQLWADVLSALKQEVSIQSYETWLKPTQGISLSNDTLIVEVPNKFFREWLVDHYYDILVKATGRISGEKLRLDFTVSSSAPSTFIPQPARTFSQAQKQGKPAHRPDVYLNPKYTFDGFVIGPSNRFAHAASSAVAESPARAYNPLFIYGGVGLGKTHLMQAVGHYILQKNPSSKLTYTSSERFTNQLISAIQNRTTMRFREKYRSVDILLIDDIQFIAGKESTQEEFFHTFNTLYDAHKQIVVSSDRPPKDINRMEERLISRFEWGLITDIQPPDLETRIAILRKKAEREVVKVPDDVMFFIGEKIRSNIRELEGSLIRVVAYSLLTNNPISISIAEEVLKDAIKEDSFIKVITLEKVIKKVADNFEIKVSDIKKGGRSKAITFPRHIAMYLSRELTNHSLSEIGEFFGGRDHTTVLHAVGKIKKQSTEDNKINDLLTVLIHKIKST